MAYGMVNMAENENTFVILQSLLTCVCVSERTRDRAAAASTERKQKARDPKAPISIWNFEGRQQVTAQVWKGETPNKGERESVSLGDKE